MTTTIAPAVQATQVYAVFIRATPERVWEAITKKEFTTRYFYGSFFESRYQPGTPYRGFTVGHDRQMLDGEIIEVRPPHFLRYTWRSLWTDEMANEKASRVTWEIEPQEGGYVKLTVVHDQLEESPITAGEVAGGWMFVLSGLKTLVETGESLTTGQGM